MSSTEKVELSAGTNVENAFALCAAGKVESAALAAWVGDRVAGGGLDLAVVNALAVKFPGALPAGAMGLIALLSSGRKADGNAMVRGAGKKPKTICPVSRDEYLQGAGVVDLTIGDDVFQASPKLFNTGSVGYYIVGRVALPIKDRFGKVVLVDHQIGCNLTAVGSKPEGK